MVMTLRTPSGIPARRASYRVDLIDCLFFQRHEEFTGTYLDDGKGGEGSLGRSLDDRSTSDSESGTHLPGNHGSGKVPGTKQSDDTDGLLDGKVPGTGHRARNDLAIGPECLGREPGEEGTGISGLGHGIVPGLAVLPNDQTGNVLDRRLVETVKLGEPIGTLNRTGVAESGKRLFGDFDSVTSVLNGHLRTGTDGLARGRVCGMIGQSYACDTLTIYSPLTSKVLPDLVPTYWPSMRPFWMKRVGSSRPSWILSIMSVVSREMVQDDLRGSQR